MSEEAQADTGHGATFSRMGDTDFEAIAEVINITAPQISRESVDRTHLQSPDSYNEYTKGMKDGGEPTITIAYLMDESHQKLQEDLEDDDEHEYQVEYPDGSTWEFKGFPTAFNPSEIAVNERLTVEVTFRTSGKPTFTEAA